MTIGMRNDDRSLQTKFEAFLPRIIAYLRKASRMVRCAESRADFIAEAVALCWKWFLRAVAKGKDVAGFVTAMAKFAARAVRFGRTVCGQQPAKDVMSVTARIRHGVVVERLGSGRTHHEALYSEVRGQRRQDVFEEALAENTVTPVPEQVVFRVDWPRFVAGQTIRDRRMMAFLAAGNSNKATAVKFGLTPGRVSQLRRSWCEAWEVFGEE
jgi:hypothetical protein